MHAMTQLDDLLTTSELAAETGYSIRSIQGWCSAGTLMAMKLGRDYVIRRSDWFVFANEYKPVKKTRKTDK